MTGAELDRAHAGWRDVLALLDETADRVPAGDPHAGEARRHLDTVAAVVRHAITRNRAARAQQAQETLPL